MSTDKCPHCGLPRLIPNEGNGFLCGTRDTFQTRECIERAARRKLEKELSEMTHDCEKYRARYKQESDDLAKERYEHAETRKELAEAYGQKRDADHRASLSDRRANQAEARATLLSVDLEETRRKLEEADGRWARIRESVRAQCGVSFWDQISSAEKGGAS